MNSPLRLAGFLIVGAMKSGTTTLGRYLNAHVAFSLPRTECHLFDRDDRCNLGVKAYSLILMADSDTLADGVG